MKERVLSSSSFLTTAVAELPEGRVLAVDGQTFIGVAIQIFNIAVICIILYKLLYKPASDILSARTKRIQDRLDALAQKEEEAQALLLEYKEKLTGADEECQLMISKARHEAEDEARRIIAEAEEEAERIKENAALAMERERQMLHREAKDHVIELSVLLAEKALKDSVSPERQDKKFEESLRELGVASWQD